MRKLWGTICIFIVCALVLATPVLADGGKGHERIPALNTVSGAAVLVPEIAVRRSPVLEPADIVVELDRGAFFMLLKEDAEVYPEEFRSALEELLGLEVEIVSAEPFLWVVVGEGATRDQVCATLQDMEDMLDWAIGRTVGWGTYW
ncbi:MAG: hypothetical protein E3J35_02820 [Methanomassiliicoccales archaeon]|nr:MAG: hypothetical protein E3J35_02820 [Methanomassiliicoccales archaeon]